MNDLATKEEGTYDRANSVPVAWIAFAGNGNIRLWTADEGRAKDEKARGLDMRAFTLAELVALTARTMTQWRDASGHYFVDGDKYHVVFRPGGGSYAGNDLILCSTATGSHPLKRAELICRALASLPPDSVREPAPPADSVVTRDQLRALVDMTWNHCTESEAVPSTKTADHLISCAIPHFEKGGA